MVAEWSYRSARAYQDPLLEVELDAIITAPDGARQTVPAFYSGEGTWRVRFSAPKAGKYVFRTECSDTENRDLHGRSGTIEVVPYRGQNPLWKHGPLQLSDDRRYIEHHDGTPFFWLADSWWLGMSSRFRWPGDFQTLAQDRKQKGFSVIQFAVAFPCDIAPFDPRGANEAGHAWTEDFGTINPAYFDLTDLRVQWLVRQGLMPNIVGAWGYYLPAMGTENMKRHWRYVVARYGAFPVTWTLAGEVTLPWYLAEDKQEQRELQRKEWSEVARYLRGIDPYHRLVTVHPGPDSGGMKPLEDMSTLDFILLQPGHGDFESLPHGIEHMQEARARYSDRPVMMGEINFEGMMAAAGPRIQRHAFWTSVLQGAPGHCYGADAIWQFNTRQAPFGKSPGGHAWGNIPWEDASQWAGATHVGLGARLLSKYRWWELQPHQDWIEPRGSAENFMQPFCAGIPGKLRLVYFPRPIASWSRSPARVLKLEPDVSYRACWLDPITGDTHEIGGVKPDADSRWTVPASPILQDWVLALEAEGAGDQP